MFVSHWMSRRRAANISLAAAVICSIVLLWRRGAIALDERSNAYGLERRQERAALAQRRSCELDRSFFLGISQNAQGGRCSVSPDDEFTDLTATIVMGRLANETERVQWVDELRGINDRQIYIVDDANSTLPHLSRNHGRESAVYLTYIVNNYDRLNNVTFFWHNDRIVWHNNMMLNWDSVETINQMNRRNVLRQGYAPARCDQWPGCPSWIKFNPSRAEYRLDPHRLEEMFTPDLFVKLFPDEKNFPPYFAGTCCSQFAVSRDTIRSRPLSTYKTVLDWVIEYQDDERSGRIMEYLWPYLFLKQGTFCPSMADCYCNTYDFCMDDQQDVEKMVNWNALRTRREEVQWQVNFLKDTMTAKAQEMRAKNESMSIEDVEAGLHSFRGEFDRLSQELERLSETTWLAREDIIHRWRLDIPPVGW